MCYGVYLFFVILIFEIHGGRFIEQTNPARKIQITIVSPPFRLKTTRRANSGLFISEIISKIYLLEAELWPSMLMKTQ